MNRTHRERKNKKLASMQGEPMFHVAGVLVHALPSRASGIAERIAVMPGVTVHAVSPEGRLVVTVESHDAAHILDFLSGLQRMDGVLSAVLVSEQSEPLSAADEVLTHDPNPT
jgi:periplasmic nitrate reductase NapD